MQKKQNTAYELLYSFFYLTVTILFYLLKLLYNTFKMTKFGEEKEFYISHSGELLIWLIVVCLMIAIFSFSFILKEKNDDNDYQIFLQDVDGLIVGSPVKMMGIEVGHVTKIKPTNDEVYVKFILTNPDVYIPQGTSVTVEFSGMAGSKSLELYLPKQGDYIDKSIPILITMPPKRLHDAFGLLNDMYKKLNSIIYSASSFGGKIDFSGIEYSTGGGFAEFIKYSNKFLDESKDKTDAMMKSVGVRK